jgi:hypothetical protein
LDAFNDAFKFEPGRRNMSACVVLCKTSSAERDLRFLAGHAITERGRSNGAQYLLQSPVPGTNNGVRRSNLSYTAASLTDDWWPVRSRTLHNEGYAHLTEVRGDAYGLRRMMHNERYFEGWKSSVA